MYGQPLRLPLNKRAGARPAPTKNKNMTTTTLKNPPQSGQDFLSHPDFAEVTRTVKLAGPRYRNEMGKFSIHRASNCISCGKCVETCRYGVHVRPAGYRQVLRPFDYKCIGPECEKTGRYCIKNCPQKALTLDENPVFKTLGDYRWTPDLLASVWSMAETGHKPPAHLESSNGQFRRRVRQAAFRVSDKVPADLRREDIDTRLLLNKRKKRFAAESDHRRPMVRRRHVVRLNQHQGPARQGTGRKGVEHLQLHGRGWIP